MCRWASDVSFIFISVIKWPLRNSQIRHNSWLRLVKIRWLFFGRWMQCGKKYANGLNRTLAKCVHGLSSGIYEPWWIKDRSEFDNIIAVIVAEPFVTNAQVIASTSQSWALNSMFEYAINAIINWKHASKYFILHCIGTMPFIYIKRYG